MADPGAEPIMILGIEDGDFCTNLFHAVDKLSAQPGVNILLRKRREEPGCTFEEIRIGKLDASLLFPRHRMTGKKSLSGIFSERLRGAPNDLGLRAANVGHESF